jgi:cytochrome c biogenesis protein CcdA
MVAGLVAFSALLTTLALNYAYEARPYAILLASACISLFAWQRSVENPKSKFAPALLAVSLAMGIYTHFYGIFNYIPLLVGETLRSFERRRISLPIIVSILVSLGLALGVYPFAVNARYLSEGFHTRNFDITTAIELYRMLLFNFTLAGAVSLVFVVIIAAVGRTEQTASDPARVPLYEVGAAITYCFIPFMIYVVARLSTNAIKDRYAIVTVIGFSLVAVYLTDMVWRKHRVSALAICLSFLLTSFYSLTTVARSFDYPGSFITGSVREFIDSADLPIVMSDGFKFLEVYHYVPRSRAKIYFFANRKDVPRYRDSDTIDIALTNIKKVEPLNTVDFSEFLSRHSKFLVYVTGGNEPRYWILRKLEDNHVKLVFRTMVDQGLVFLADSESSATAALR